MLAGAWRARNKIIVLVAIDASWRHNNHLFSFRATVTYPLVVARGQHSLVGGELAEGDRLRVLFSFSL